MLYETLLTGILLLSAVAVVIQPATADDEVYELRTYTTYPGKLDNLNARFRDHTIGLFNKHGMTSVGYWVPTDDPAAQNTLIYVLRHKSREAAQASWKAFLSDPEWKQVAEESQRDGQILAKRPESVFMRAADYTPEFKGSDQADGAVFELRVYRCEPNRLDNLDARFRDHTIGLFNRHGMQSVAYWHPTDEPSATDTLIYILRHKNKQAAEASWAAFRGDKEWQHVRATSEQDGAILREAPESTFMIPTDYSMIK